MFLIKRAQRVWFLSIHCLLISLGVKGPDSVGEMDLFYGRDSSRRNYFMQMRLGSVTS